MIPLSEDCPRCRAKRGDKCRGERGTILNRPHKGREVIAALRSDNAQLRLERAALQSKVESLEEQAIRFGLSTEPPFGMTGPTE